MLTGIQLSAACVKLIASVERLDEIDNGSGVRAEVKLSAPAGVTTLGQLHIKDAHFTSLSA